VVRGGGGEVAANSERYLVLRVVYPDGSESENFRIEDEAIFDLREFFSTLPDGKYRIYLVRTENNSDRLVIEVDVRQGRVIDVSDDSEGTRDRPPTEEDASKAVPLEENPLLKRESAEEAAATNATDASAMLDLNGARILAIRQAELDGQVPNEKAKSEDEADDRVSFSPVLGVSLSLAALAAAEPWSRRVDTALAEADENAWQRLRQAGRRARNWGRPAAGSKLPKFTAAASSAANQLQ
jgi:hypothetical protein